MKKIKEERDKIVFERAKRNKHVNSFLRNVAKGPVEEKDCWAMMEIFRQSFIREEEALGRLIWEAKKLTMRKGTIDELGQKKGLRDR